MTGPALTYPAWRRRQRVKRGALNLLAAIGWIAFGLYLLAGLP